jgi:hypothetical protein
MEQTAEVSTHVQRSHVSSLGELLAAHGLVKVQLNAVNSDVHAVGHELADGTGVASIVVLLSNRLTEATYNASTNRPSTAVCLHNVAGKSMNLIQLLQVAHWSR